VLLVIFAYLYGHPRSREIIVLNPAHEVWDQVQLLSPLVQLTIFVFVAYIVGVAWEQVFTALVNSKLGPIIRRLPLMRQLRSGSWVVRWPLAVVYPLTTRERILTDPKIERFVRGTIRRRIDSSVADFIPKEFVIDDFRETAIGMSDEKSILYQDWDRLTEEASFRRAIAIPVLLYALLPYTYFGGGTFSLAVVIVICAIVYALVSAGRTSSFRASELVATTLYQNLASSPSLNAMQDEWKRDDIDAESSHAHKLAWLIGYLGLEPTTLDYDGKYTLATLLREYRTRRDAGLIDEALSYTSEEVKYNLRLYDLVLEYSSTRII
jgi:hypothetical protein